MTLTVAYTKKPLKNELEFSDKLEDLVQDYKIKDESQQEEIVDLANKLSESSFCELILTYLDSMHINNTVV